MQQPIKREDVATMDFSDITTGETIPAATPGDILRFDFMQPLGLSAAGIARKGGIPTRRIIGILHGTGGITAETALVLAEQLGTSPEFWMNLQSNHDLLVARERRRSAGVQAPSAR